MSVHTGIQGKGLRRAELTSLRPIVHYHSEALVQTLCNGHHQTMSAHARACCLCSEIRTGSLGSCCQTWQVEGPSTRIMAFPCESCCTLAACLQ